MTGGIEIIGTNALDFLFDKTIDFLKNGLEKKIYKILGQIKIDIIKRTQSGKDPEGKEYQKYSKKYKAYKEEERHRPADIVTLTFKGHMLESISENVLSDGAELYFDDEDERKKAVKHEFGLGRMPKRPFFSLDTKNQDYVINNISKAIDKVWG